MDRADDRARGEIAKYFKTKIVSVTRDEEKYHQVDEGGERTVTHEFMQKIHSRVRAEAELEGVTVPMRQVVQGQYYSLAVLDKLAQGRVLMQRIAEMEMEMEERLAVPASQAHDRARALARVLFLHHKRARTVGQLRLLGGNAEVDHAFAEKTADELRQLLGKHYPVGVDCDSEELSVLIREALIDAGLVVAADGKGVVGVQGVLELQDSKDDRGRFEVVYRVRLTATLNGEQVAAREKSERFLHPKLEGARMKALIEIRKMAVEPFVKKMEAHLLGDYDKEVKR